MDRSVIAQPRMEQDETTVVIPAPASVRRSISSPTNVVGPTRKLSVSELARGDSSSAPLPLGRHEVQRTATDNLRLRSVVELHVTTIPAIFNTPWKQGDEYSCTGTGFCIEGRLIISNDHVVHQHSQIRVTKPGCATKFIAKVVSAAREVDLAFLSVDNEEFWEGMPFLRFSPQLSRLGATVMCAGYPTGGSGISITVGVVSRICLNAYYVGCAKLLTIQIDAAINPGNSGGPVFDTGGHVIGVARSVFESTQNIGFIISAEVCQMALQQIRDHSRFLGVSSIAIHYQTLESEAFREALHLPEKEKGGIRVSEVSKMSPLHKEIQVDDILLAINGEKIASDATILLSKDRPDERLHFTYLISKRPIGSECTLTVFKQAEGKEVDVETVTTATRWLCPLLHEVDCLPRYFIVGGLVFIPLTQPWFDQEDGSATHAIIEKLPKFPETKEAEVLLLVSILASDVNFGYQDFDCLVLEKCNGLKVENLVHLVKLVDESEEKFLKFEFLDRATIIVDKKKCVEAKEEIFRRHFIKSSRQLKNVDRDQLCFSVKPMD